jgi:hypothetical protein
MGGMNEELETPVTARNRIRHVGSDLVKAELDLKNARDREVAAKHDYEKALRAALLSPEAPRVQRGGATVADRDAWAEDRCDAQRFAYMVAEANRQASQTHYATLNTQAMLAQAILKSIDRAFSVGAGRDE